MSLPIEKPLRVILYEGTGSQPLPTEERYATICALLERGFAVTRTTDGPPAHALNSHVLVLGSFPGGRTPFPEARPGEVELHVLAIDGLSVPDIAQAVEKVRSETHAARHGDWKPWFPVIDYDRCTHCMQCLSFCLFGVYGVDTDKRIQARNLDNCKTNCPACSRVCPEAAIIFPKYKAGPINGDAVSDSDLQREKIKVDISALLGGDIYSLLRSRSERAQGRFSKERDADKALHERQKCLAELAQLADIPAEVLMSLPSPEEITRRAGEAAARAKAALGN